MTEEYGLSKLLIVPYGIETVTCSLIPAHRVLLIVPYGIETMFYLIFIVSIIPFNRTLWN